MTILIYLLMFFLGGAVGSFVNVMISRSVAGKGWIKGRSVCDHCGKQLSWFDMIPVFSYLFFLGRSRCCKKRLSYGHIIVETLFGLLFVWWMAIGRWFFQLVGNPLASLQPMFWLVTGILLLIILIADWDYQLIPMPVVYLGTVLTITYRLILWGYGEYQGKDLVTAVLAAGGIYLFLQLLRVVTSGKGMGDGDPPLAFWLGLVVGWPRSLVYIWVAFVVGGISGIILLITGKTKGNTPLPFGPFLIIGLVIALLTGTGLWHIFGLG